MCLFQAVLQVQAYPGRFRPLAVEDAEVVCAIMLNVSLNAQRKNVVYHCSKQSATMLTENNSLHMMGFPCKQVSYAAFKAECQKLGASNPLHSFWALVDHYAPYWIEHARSAPSGKWPIDDSTVVDDCHPLPEKPNAMRSSRALYEWAMAHPSMWPFDLKLMRADLSFETIVGPAAKLCESYGLPFDTVVPDFVRQGLQRICAEVDSPHIREEARPAIAFNLQSRLESRVHLFKLLQMHPEIRDEPLERPVFILGLNRTGTTFLYRLLEASGAFAAPHVEEQNVLPCAAQLANPDPAKQAERLEFFEDQLKDLTEAFAGIHELGVGLAEEDMCAHSHAFASLEYDLVYELPQYRQWLEGHMAKVGTQVYAEHKLWMQMTAWTRRRAHPDKRAPARWCFKMPWHVKSLGALTAVYPDAVIVHTHRPVMEVAGSWCSLVERQRERNVVTIDRAVLGAQQLDVLASMLNAGTDFRNANPLIAPRWLDVYFGDIIATPAKVAGKVIRHAGMRVDSPTSEALEKYVATSTKNRRKAKLHKYDSRHYQLDEASFSGKAFVAYETDLSGRKGSKLVEAVQDKLPHLVALGLAAVTAGVAAVYSS